MVQEKWPHENTREQRLYFGPDTSLANTVATDKSLAITDLGQTQKLESLVEKPNKKNEGRLVFLTAPLEKKTLLSGTARVSLNLSVLNRKAANITIAIVEYDKLGRGKIITRGWADPQNHHDITQGEALVPGKNYQMLFDLEPKQYLLAAGSKLGVVIASTDYDYTLRPKEGTIVQFNLGANSFIELKLASSKSHAESEE
jgi:X-Pro dipeptidyl-peptidase